MSAMRLTTGAVVLAAVIAGCARDEEPASSPSPRTELATNVFLITSTNEVVLEESLPPVPKSRLVRADFNMDDLEDLARAETNEDGDTSIAIYLQKKSLSKTAEREFFCAGGIRMRGEYDVTALMSTKQGDRVNLVVIFRYPDASKEMIHFQTDGREFREIMRKSIDE